MKNALFFAATLSLLFIGQVAAHAQKTATWKGGAPGRSTDWSCAQNWADSRVPNEFSDVVIPNVSTTSGAQPVIRSNAGSVNSLTLLAGAQLRIEKTGALAVLERMEVLDANSIRNAGTLEMPVSTLKSEAARGKALAVQAF